MIHMQSTAEKDTRVVFMTSLMDTVLQILIPTTEMTAVSNDDKKKLDKKDLECVHCEAKMSEESECYYENVYNPPVEGTNILLIYPD